VLLLVAVECATAESSEWKFCEISASPLVPVNFGLSMLRVKAGICSWSLTRADLVVLAALPPSRPAARFQRRADAAAEANVAAGAFSAVAARIDSATALIPSVSLADLPVSDSVTAGVSAAAAREASCDRKLERKLSNPGWEDAE
jgi:hypothetical protein